MTSRTKHLDFENLLELAEGRAVTEAIVQSHLGSCSTCAEELNRIQNLLQVMQQDESVDAPRDLLSYAINVYRQRNVGEKHTLVERIKAALTFDSFTRNPAFGLRSGQAAARQVIYAAGESDLDLRIEAREQDRWAIAGQLLGRNCNGGEVTLRGDNQWASAVLNELCEFALPSVPAGNYALIVTLADIEIEVPRIEIGG
jgi:hypothetical protein